MEAWIVKVDASGGVVASREGMPAAGWMAVDRQPQEPLIDPARMVPRYEAADGVLTERTEAALDAAAAGLLLANGDTASKLVRLLADMGVLPMDRLVGLPEAFRLWRPGTADGPQAYAQDEVVQALGRLYRCCQAHTHRGEPGWTPGEAPALWVDLSRMPDDAEAIPDWTQPTGAQDAYAAGARVRHAGALWESLIDANTAEPGTDGRWWMAVEDETATEGP